MLLALAMTGMTAFAAVPDTARTGSITVTMLSESTGATVAGGTLTAYQVGTVAENDGNYSFAMTDDFAGSGVSLTDMDSQDLSALASILSSYVSDKGLEGTTVKIDSDGVATFSDLTLGLYLIVQNTSASGYYAVSPFLVTVPILSDGEYVYDVNATPKTEALSKKSSGGGSSGGSSGSGGGSSSSSSVSSSSSDGPGVSSGESGSGSQGELSSYDPGSLELPVMADWDYTRLRIAPCRYTGAVETDDLTIAAHNYSRHFGMLKNLAGGEEVVFTDMEGNATHYIVAETEILAPTAIEEMTGSGYPLSLFTCTYGGQTRVTVRCDYKTENE